MCRPNASCCRRRRRGTVIIFDSPQKDERHCSSLLAMKTFLGRTVKPAARIHPMTRMKRLRTPWTIHSPIKTKTTNILCRIKREAPLLRTIGENRTLFLLAENCNRSMARLVTVMINSPLAVTLRMTMTTTTNPINWSVLTDRAAPHPSLSSPLESQYVILD